MTEHTESPGDDGDDAEPAAELREALLGVTAHGQRIDRALQALAPEFSRNHLQTLLRQGFVRLDGAVVAKPAQKVQAGQLLAVSMQPTADSRAFVAEPMELQVLFEDHALLVLDKPAGLVVHPAAGNWSGTLLNGLLARAALFHSLPRAGIVHRLDKDTSGLMVVAKTLPAATALVAQIARREVSRRYLAIAHRQPGERWPFGAGAETVTVETEIGRDVRNRLRMAVVGRGANNGRHARTDITLLQQQGDWALLLCKLHTGRTHQIRVHAKHLGLPLVGDAIYGGVSHPAIGRQALHAWRLSFAHPLGTAGEVAVHSEPPADMQALAAALGFRMDALPSALSGTGS